MSEQDPKVFLMSQAIVQAQAAALKQKLKDQREKRPQPVQEQSLSKSMKS